ncbi:hypothetical protein BKA69DRAFT_1168015 [Paraphysoderma sedebokerense]|nr:hypothetical protein BKA69DRAFT_1168015 [Paraphysoderma sedebokerense]
MSQPQSHFYQDFEFHSSRPDIQSVIVTGDFDEWSESTIMFRNQDSWNVTVKLDKSLFEGKRIHFKFIVNGTEWVCSSDYESEQDMTGNVNNYVNVPVFNDEENQTSGNKGNSKAVKKNGERKSPSLLQLYNLPNPPTYDEKKIQDRFPVKSSNQQNDSAKPVEENTITTTTNRTLPRDESLTHLSDAKYLDSDDKALLPDKRSRRFLAFFSKRGRIMKGTSDATLFDDKDTKSHKNKASVPVLSKQWWKKVLGLDVNVEISGTEVTIS